MAWSILPLIGQRPPALEPTWDLTLVKRGSSRQVPGGGSAREDAVYSHTFAKDGRIDRGAFGPGLDKSP